MRAVKSAGAVERDDASVAKASSDASAMSRKGTQSEARATGDGPATAGGLRGDDQRESLSDFKFNLSFKQST